MTSPVGQNHLGIGRIFEPGVFARPVAPVAQARKAVSEETLRAGTTDLPRSGTERPLPTAAPSTNGAAPKANILSLDTMQALQQAEGPTGALTDAESKEVRDLKRRDQNVRQHERAHAAAGGAYAGAPAYQFETGPDGRRYAVSGEVPIDVSPVSGDPDATIRKMDQVKSAAMAPAEPSSQDRAVAATADAKKAQAETELRQEEPEAETVGPASMLVDLTA